MSAKPCGTCTKAVYPQEKVAISDIWVHKQCLKCCVCHSTLRLNSVYISVADGGQKKLFCKSDVPRTIHTAVVDSIALRHALTAPKADAPGTKPLSGGKQGSMRFKGLTLRSKGMHGVNTPKLAVQGGVDRVVVGMARGQALDSWDVTHAMEVQSQTSAPISSFPALKAQHTGSLMGQWMSPSILTPQATGNFAPGKGEAEADGPVEDDGIAREGGKEEINIEKNLVKNLMRAFQLDSLEVVEMPSSASAPSPTSASPSPSIISTGPQSFSSIKLATGSKAGSTDLIRIATLGTARANAAARASTAGKKSLQSMFDPPAADASAPAPVAEAEGEGDKKPAHHDHSHQTVRFSDRPVSVIEYFAPSSTTSSEFSIPLPASPTGADDEQTTEEDRELIARQMEEAGLEVVFMYEEDPEAETAVTTEG